jgi:hypothetical protein
MTNLGKESGGDTSPPIGKRFELPVSIQQPQDVSLRMQRVRDFIAGVVDRLRPGRKIKYERAPIIEAAELLIKGGVDVSSSQFRGRVRSWLEWKDIPVPGESLLKEICGPIYRREKHRKKTGT